MKESLLTDNDGIVINIDHHDGYLLGAVFSDGYYKSLDVFIESESGTTTILRISEIEGSLLTNFCDGSTIACIFQFRSEDARARQYMNRLQFLDSFGLPIGRTQGKICLCVECVNDCRLVIVCNKIEVNRTRPNSQNARDLKSGPEWGQ
jgi:hypothetical protein